MEENYKSKIDFTINQLFNDCSFNAVPVNVEHIALSHGIKIKKYDFHEDISGVLVIDDDGSAIIGYNPNESKNRIRFSIAHELGHYFLHSDRTKGIFIDKMMFRKNIKHYDKKEEVIEIEANYFAANLLMPKVLVLNEINKLDSYADDEQNILHLATIFGVSVSAMTYRLINLGVYNGAAF